MKYELSFKTTIVVVLTCLYVSNLLSYPSHLSPTMRQCTFTGPNATLCNLNINQQLCVGGNLNVEGIISGTDGMGFGNTLIVDQVDGNDTLGEVNGPRFKTISAACAKAQPGDIIWVFPGVYNESITVPPFVSLSGIAIGNVVVTQQNVTQDTDLVTLSDGANISNFSLVLTSQMHVRLRGLVFPPSTISPTIRSTAVVIGIIVDNSGAGTGTSEVYGIHFSGPGTTIPQSNLGLGQTFVSGSILVNSTGSGRKRGVLIDTENALNVLASVVNTFGGTDSIGVELDDPNSLAILDGAIINGGTSDISQTNGDLNLLATVLGNSQANGLGFDTLTKTSSFIFADPNFPIGPGDTLFLRPGTAEASAVPITIPASHAFLAKSITVRAIVPPGPGESTTITVQRQRPIDIVPLDTPLTITLSDDQTEANFDEVSVHYDALDKLAVKIQNSAGAGTSDVLASVNIY